MNFWNKLNNESINEWIIFSNKLILLSKQHGSFAMKQIIEALCLIINQINESMNKYTREHITE